jgi:tripartite-type tricarboxylate transporter receptor subunit TctC
MGAPAVARAQSYPEREVRLVVPFPAGGVTHLTAQLVAKHLSARWRQNVRVVNMPGQGGTTGTMFVLGSRNDGYTMLMSATGQATQNPAIVSKLPYRWDEPALVARINVSPLVFVVRGDSPWASLKDLMQAIRRDPAGFKYGTSGAGGVGSIAIAQVLAASGIDANRLGRVVLQGGSPLLEAVMEGRTDFAAQYLGEMSALLKAGKLRGLAVSTVERVPQLPDVPTGEQAGVEAFKLIGWNGIAGPANLPDELVRVWADAIREMTADPGFVAEIRALGATPAYLGPVDFKAALEKEYATALHFALELGMRK